jgi:hypothetical protein
MKQLKNTLMLLLFCLILLSCGQTKTADIKNGDYKVLAKLISFEGGDKIHFAKFEVLKDLSETLDLHGTITVGYYNYKQPDSNIDTVILTLKEYAGETTIENYFICPDYDGKANIQKAKIEFIDFDYWEGCETGEGECKPLTFTRTKAEKNWFLIMPCGGTETSVSVSGEGFSTELELSHDNCPPCLDLSNLENGDYTASMMACGLGGTVKFNLATK